MINLDALQTIIFSLLGLKPPIIIKSYSMTGLASKSLSLLLMQRVTQSGNLNGYLYWYCQRQIFHNSFKAVKT
jgi:hypothetical protein